jgi:hypothetical protein
VLEACRADLRASLGRAVDAVVAAQGTGRPRRVDLRQAERPHPLVQLGLAGVPTFDFQNRPTFQQVASFTRSRADAPAAAPPGARPVTKARPALAATGPVAFLPLVAVGALLAGAALHRRRRPTLSNGTRAVRVSHR